MPLWLGSLQINASQSRVEFSGRKVLFALNAYASEHNGLYPDGASANDAFRMLIKGGYLPDELLFGSGYYLPDGNLGEAPDYPKALTQDENGWAMTKGLSAKVDGATPLIFENPLLATWPPRWDARALGIGKPGRIWTNWTVMVGRIDGSVCAEQLVQGDAPTTTLKPIKDGKNLFELAGPHEVLDVAK